MTAPFLYYEMVKKRNIGGEGQNLGIRRYVTFERSLTCSKHLQISILLNHNCCLSVCPLLRYAVFEC